MRTDIARLLPPGSRVLALPNASAPRLFLVSDTAWQRWRHSSHYPAFHWTARLHARALRLGAALGLFEGKPNPGTHWPLGTFLEDCLPGAEASVVAVGTAGPASKLTVQVWRGNAVVGYVKLATTPAAAARLEHEASVVRALPAGLGPTVLKIADFDGGRALVTASVTGRPVSAHLPMHQSVRRFLATFPQSSTWPIEQHPWVARLREYAAERLDLKRVLEPLASATWPEVVQHGDFAPWNVLQDGGGRLVAIDWEYGDLRGLPHLDAAYYHLQVAALMRRWAPDRAREHAVQHRDPALTPGQADAIVRLAAVGAHFEATADGHSPDADLQAWRRAVWAGR